MSGCYTKSMLNTFLIAVFICFMSMALTVFVLFLILVLLWASRLEEDESLEPDDYEGRP